MNQSSGEIAVYTDGACYPNPGPGGYGVVLIADGQRRELSGGFRKTTNNRMELFSVIRALQELNSSPGKITIHCDAQYVVHMYNGGYAQRWRRDGWTRNRRRDPALNPDLWEVLLDLCARREVEFIWVRGHGDNVENVRCDELAVLARSRADLPADEGYERPLAPAPAAQLTLFDGES